MSRLTKLRPTPALVVALAALVAAMSGAAIALPGKNDVKKNDIAKGAVTSKALAKNAVKGRDIAQRAVKTKHIARGAIGSRQIKGKSIRGNRLKDKAIKAKQIADKAITAAQIEDNTITSAQVADNGLNTSDLSDVKTFAAGPVTATNGANPDAARDAAPKVELYRKGQLSLYGKCFRDTSVDVTFAEIFIETSADGAIFDADDELSGGPAATDFLNTDTPEEDRQVEDDAFAPTDDAEAAESELMAMAPDGTRIVGQYSAAAKNGDLAGGNGVYGPGNVCLFSGQISG